MPHKNLTLLTITFLASSVTAFALSIQDKNNTSKAIANIISVDNNKTEKNAIYPLVINKNISKDTNDTNKTKIQDKNDLNEALQFEHYIYFKINPDTNTSKINNNKKRKDKKQKKYNISSDLNLLAEAIIAMNHKTNKVEKRIDSIEKNCNTLKRDIERYKLNNRKYAHKITSNDISLLDKITKKYKRLSYRNKKRIYKATKNLIFFDYPINKSWAVHNEVTILKKGSKIKLDKCYKNWLHVKYRGWIKNEGILPKINCK